MGHLLTTHHPLLSNIQGFQIPANIFSKRHLLYFSYFIGYKYTPSPDIYMQYLDAGQFL